MRGVVLDLDSLHPTDLDLSAWYQQLPDWQFYPMTSAEQVLDRCQHQQVILTNKVVLNADTLRQLPELRFIGILATGTNNVDLAVAAERDIVVCNAPRYCTPAVVQHVFTLLLSLNSHLSEYELKVKGGAWTQSPFFCLLQPAFTELAGKKLGIVGYGELGQAVAKVAEAFGMKVMVAQRPGSDVCPVDRWPLAELLAEVDFLSLHCPLTPDTNGLIDQQALALMKPSARLINCARGGIVDEVALANALRAGSLAGAGIDVLSQEPPPADHPLLANDIPNLILTPHSAWASRESRQRLVEISAANIGAFKTGQVSNQVN